LEGVALLGAGAEGTSQDRRPLTAAGDTVQGDKFATSGAQSSV
jgi:hypothetical protein